MLIKALAGQENISNKAIFFMKFYTVGLGIEMPFFRL